MFFDDGVLHGWPVASLGQKQLAMARHFSLAAAGALAGACLGWAVHKANDAQTEMNRLP